MFCSQKKYADLVMWTKEDVHIERIYPDDEFWVDKVSRVKLFFENSILPELLGKFFHDQEVLYQFFQKAKKKFTVTVEDLKKEI